MKILECSSKGDKRFSAFYAKVEVFGKYASIEEHYQFSKQFLSFTPKNILQCKGLKPTSVKINDIILHAKYLSQWYTYLWIKYLDQHPELVQYAKGFDDFNDIFKGKSINCQADVIRKYIKKGRRKCIDDCRELIKIFKKMDAHK